MEDSGNPEPVKKGPQQELIFNHSSEPTFLIGVEKDGRYRFITVNAAFLHISGLTREQVEGKYADEVIPAELHNRIFSRYAQAIQERQSLQWEDTADYPDGQRTNVISITPVFNEQGEPTILVGTLHDITERKLVEEKLQIREKQLELIYNTVSDIIFQVSVEPGPRYKFSSVNNAFLSLSGLSTEQLEGKYVEEVIPPSSLPLTLKQYEKAITERRKCEWEDILEYPAGKKNGIISITPVFNDQGECNILVGSIHDITELKKALIEKDKVTYSLKERVKELTTVYRVDQLLQSADQTIEQVLQSFVSILPHGWQYPDITEARISLGDQQFATPGFDTAVESQSAEFLTTDGKTGKIEVAYTQKTSLAAEGPFLTEERNMINLLAEMLRIYLARKEEAAQLLKEKELSESMMNSLPGVFYMFDSDGKYILWNKNHETVTGYSAEEMKSMHPLMFIDDADKQMIEEKMRKVFVEGYAEVETDFLFKGGQKKPYFFNGIAINYNGKPCIMGVGLDITERKKMEKEIMDQKVQEQKKMIRAVLSGQEKERNKIGQELHDNVNQILAGAKMYLGYIKDKSPEVAQTIQQSISLLDSAIDEIRSLTREQVTPQRRIDLKDHIQSLVDNLNAHSSVRTFFNYNTGVFPIDEDLKINIYRIVQESINNILKHSAATIVTITIKADDTELHILIDDNGKGFSTSVSGKGGTGITNILNRVESYNGKVMIESSPGNGCRIAITTPL